MSLREPLDVRFIDDRAMPRRARPPVLPPVEERVDDDALRHERPAVEIVARRLGESRSDTGTPLRSSSMDRRSLWRTDRAAAWPDCTSSPGRASTVHAPGSRTVAPVSRRADSHASKAPSVPAVRHAFPSRRCRTGTSSTRSATSENTREIGSDSVEGGAEGCMMSWPDAHVREMVA